MKICKYRRVNKKVYFVIHCDTLKLPKGDVFYVFVLFVFVVFYLWGGCKGRGWIQRDRNEGLESKL